MQAQRLAAISYHTIIFSQKQMQAQRLAAPSREFPILINLLYLQLKDFKSDWTKLL